MPDDPGTAFWRELASIGDRLERRLRFVAWLTRMLAPQGVRPIVVGGHALEFYTLGDYATGDVDLVCTDIAAAAKVLQAAGFQREGRYWYREDVDLAVEFPDTDLHGSPDRVEAVSIGEEVVYLIGKEDLLIDRLNACEHWPSEEDCIRRENASSPGWRALAIAAGWPVDGWSGLARAGGASIPRFLTWQSPQGTRRKFQTPNFKVPMGRRRNGPTRAELGV
ncbi:MAG: hypothetical protein QHJ81_15255 [Anaerolineae bacterium]|nr:hypothetical protein [Anaerolineae bacterium]